MAVYNKIFTKILDSSIWLEPTATRLVWLTLIASMDEDGFAQFASAQNLSHRAIISLQDTEKAIQCLESPDPNSSDPDNDGRRIEKVPGGWMVLNSGKYRDLITRAVAKEQTRKRVAKHRAKKACNAVVTVANGEVKKVTLSEAVSEALSDTVSEAVSEAVSDTDTDTKRKYASLPRFQKPSFEEIKLQCAKIGLSDKEAERFFNYYESNGWRVGRNPMKSWPAALTNWKINARNYQNSRKPTAENPRNFGMPSTTKQTSERIVAELKARGGQ